MRVALVLVAALLAGCPNGGGGNDGGGGGSAGSGGGSAGGAGGGSGGSGGGGADAFDAGSIVASFDTGGTVTGLARDAFDNRLYLTVATGPASGNIQIIDTSVLQPFATLDAGGYPVGIVVDSSTHTAFATIGNCAADAGAIAFITGNSFGHVAAPRGFDVGLAVKSGGSRFFATVCDAGRVEEYASGNALPTGMSWPTPGRTAQLAYDPAATTLFWFGDHDGGATLRAFDTMSATAPRVTTSSGTAIGVAAISNSFLVATRAPDTARLGDSLPLALLPNLQPTSVHAFAAALCVEGCLNSEAWEQCFALDGGAEQVARKTGQNCGDNLVHLDADGARWLYISRTPGTNDRIVYVK